MPSSYISVTEAAAKWGRPRPTVKRWCQVGAIPGVIRIGQQFGIPADAVPPELPKGAAAHKRAKRRKPGAA